MSHEQKPDQLPPPEQPPTYAEFRHAVDDLDVDRAHVLAIQMLEGRIDQSLAAAPKEWETGQYGQLSRVRSKRFRFDPNDPQSPYMDGRIEIIDKPKAERQLFTERRLGRNEVTRLYNVGFTLPSKPNDKLFNPFVHAQWNEAASHLEDSPGQMLRGLANVDSLIVCFEAFKDTVAPLEVPRSKVSKLLGRLGVKRS